MKRRTFVVSCDASTAQRLADAIRGYAHAAFPDGGSECAQVSRAALVDSAARCAAHRGGELTLRRRQRAQLRAAIEWYYGEGAAADPEAAERLRRLLETA